MARCAYCGTDTQLHQNGTPICIQCADLPPEKRVTRAKLVGDLYDATVRADAASAAFTEVTSKIPSSIPHPDGVQRIHNVSREMAEARSELMRAHTRLNDFLERGIVPEDLKRSG